MKHPYCHALITTSEAIILKTFSLLAETLQPKQKFVPNDRHDQQQFSTMESATFPPDAALSCVYVFIVSSKEASLFSLLLSFSELAVPLVLSDRGPSLCVATVTER